MAQLARRFAAFRIRAESSRRQALSNVTTARSSSGSVVPGGSSVSSAAWTSAVRMRPSAPDDGRHWSER